MRCLRPCLQILPVFYHCLWHLQKNNFGLKGQSFYAGYDDEGYDNLFKKFREKRAEKKEEKQEKKADKKQRKDDKRSERQEKRESSSEKRRLKNEN